MLNWVEAILRIRKKVAFSIAPMLIIAKRYFSSFFPSLLLESPPAQREPAQRLAHHTGYQPKGYIPAPLPPLAGLSQDASRPSPDARLVWCASRCAGSPAACACGPVFCKRHLVNTYPNVMTIYFPTNALLTAHLTEKIFYSSVEEIRGNATKIP